MDKISSQIILSLTLDSTWYLVTDFDNYNNWHPGILEIDGKLKPRRRLKIRWKYSRFQLKSKWLRVNYFKKMEMFSWISSSLIYGLLDLHYIFKFKEVNMEKTRFIQEVEISGLAVIWLRKYLIRKISEELKAINESLQFYTEYESH